MIEIDVKLQDNQTNKIYDISELVSDLEWETNILDQPGKFVFNCIDDGDVIFNKGALVIFKKKETKETEWTDVFYGYVFISNITDDDIIAVTCYDQLRYLQNRDEFVISGMTASQIFEMVCQQFNLKYKVISPTTLIIPPKIHDGATLFDVIDFGIGYELRMNKEWYIIRDNFGTLEFVNITALKSDLMLSDEDYITKFEYVSEIDKDTYNQVKIMQEERENKKGKPVKTGGKVVGREYGFVKDDSTINQWGILQYFEKSTKHLNPVQLQEYAQAILSRKDREGKTLSITSFGDISIQGGSQLFIKVGKLERVLSGYKCFLVLAASHKFSNNEHEMTLQIMLPQTGTAVV